ncbi:hypothetical protein HanIR_Chr15g0750191 [Helianthus annuus]|nr:hypothetical protein HanIR_Chr15g0750191 [Helianthus annuus]
MIDESVSVVGDAMMKMSRDRIVEDSRSAEEDEESRPFEIVTTRDPTLLEKLRTRELREM